MEIWIKSRRACGCPRIHVALVAEGERLSRKRVARLSTAPPARTAGLGDHSGFDLLVVRAGGWRRHLEVRGRAGRSDVWLEENEYRVACNLGKEYWLHMVLDCATSAPPLLRLRDPFTKLIARGTTRLRISVGEVMGAAEADA